MFVEEVWSQFSKWYQSWDDQLRYSWENGVRKAFILYRKSMGRAIYITCMFVFPFLSFSFLSFPFLSFPFLSFPFLSFSFLFSFLFFFLFSFPFFFFSFFFFLCVLVRIFSQPWPWTVSYHDLWLRFWKCFLSLCFVLFFFWVKAYWGKF